MRGAAETVNVYNVIWLGKCQQSFITIVNWHSATTSLSVDESSGQLKWSFNGELIMVSWSTSVELVRLSDVFCAASTNGVSSRSMILLSIE